MNIHSGHKVGIKGWLLFYLIITSVFVLINFLDLCLNFLIGSIFDVMSNRFINTMITYLLIVFVSILSILFLCLKKPFTPLSIVIIEAFKIGLFAKEFISSEKSIYDWSSLLFSTLLGLVWIIYFIRSNRVKNTFFEK